MDEDLLTRDGVGGGATVSGPTGEEALTVDLAEGGRGDNFGEDEDADGVHGEGEVREVGEDAIDGYGVRGGCGGVCWGLVKSEWRARRRLTSVFVEELAEC